MSVFAKQTLLKIRADTEVDLSDATEHKILYKDPKGKKGSFEGTVVDTVIEYQVQTGDITVPGLWTFHAKWVIGGKIAYGEKFIRKFEEPLD